MTKRLPTHGDRNEDRRHRSAPLGVPVELPEDITGQYEGEELAMLRGRRETHIRLARLEDHKDKSLVMFTEVNTKLGMLVNHAEKTETREEAREKREHEARESERRRKWILAAITCVAAAIVALIGALR